MERMEELKYSGNILVCKLSSTIPIYLKRETETAFLHAAVFWSGCTRIILGSENRNTIAQFIADEIIGQERGNQDGFE